MHESHIENLLELIEIERDAENEENKRGLEKYPLHVREALGKTVTRLHISSEDVGVGGMPLLVLTKGAAPKPTRGPRKHDLPEAASLYELSPFHAMNQGDNVLLTYPSGTTPPNVDGTLYDVGELSVTVALNTPIPNPMPNGYCQLDMLGSDATYKRMRQALNLVRRSERAELVRLRDICLGQGEPKTGKPSELELFNTRLNQFQIDAAKKALAAPEVAVIHGPPGTGKTTVLVEVIVQAVKRGERILASAPSNIAVDNMVEKLLPYDLRIVRLGHPARVMEALHHVTLSAQVEENPGQREIQMMDEERHKMMNQLRRKRERGSSLTYDERKDTEAYIEQLWKKARDQEFAIRREIIENAQVVLATHGGINHKQLGRKKFDLVAMDEASQATEPLSWIPVSLAKKVVFAGDSCQLPPTIYSREAAERGLSTTLFDRLQKNLPPELQTLLRVQYRMHEIIMGFSSQHFYGGKLLADESVRLHTAAELPLVKPSALTEAPLAFIDTAGTGYEETWNELLESRENSGEAELVMKVVEALKYSGVQSYHIALLTPYVAQVKRLRAMCKDWAIEIGSVDSFQGREKEIVILSLVRSNPDGEVGFLSDTRRMNVGMTRARRLLIVIGDSATIARHSFYRSFIDYVDHHDAHKSAWEWKSE